MHLKLITHVVRQFLVLLLIVSLVGSRSIAAFANELPDIGSSADTIMSPEDEKKLGKEFMRQVRSSFKLIDDIASIEYIQNLGTKLASQIDTRDQTFTFFIVNDPTINAFAGPGGYIGVHTGLISAAQTEGELASVLAHEIAHVVQRHLIRSLESSNTSQKLSLATFGAMLAAIILGGHVDGQVSEAVIASTVAGSAQHQLSFSRAHEQEADRVGIEMLYRAGYDPENMANFFEILQQHTRLAQNDIPEFLLTHPVTASRIADARNRAAALPPIPKNSQSDHGYSVFPTAFEIAKTRIEVLTSTQQQQNEAISILEKIISKKQKLTPLRQYEIALRYQKIDEYDKARHWFNALLKSEPQRISYIVAAAENEIADQKYQTAIRLMREKLLIYPNNYELTTLYAQAALLNHEATDAQAALQNLIRANHFRPATYKLLATASQQAGRNSEAYEALGEYYYELGDINIAIKHFEAALENSDNDKIRNLRLKAKIAQLKKELLKIRTEPQNSRNYFDKPL